MATVSTKKQITRDNHYVPQWYQRGFFAKGQHKLHVLNLHPAARSLPEAPGLMEPEIEELDAKLAFKEIDLYTTRFGETLNDDIETFLFGKIDKCGADAVRAWAEGDPVKIQRRFEDFFSYMDAQKLRTPKGLDWILKQYRGLPQIALMEQMQSLRQMHCTMWSESVREIVSAVKSPVKFLVSDHPVTIYHPMLPPDAIECQYPDDPGIELIGSQTVYALNANYCLILTILEHAKDPDSADLLSRRTNARFRGATMVRTDALIRGRELSEAEVHAINRVIKARARKYVASLDPSWLYPERYCTQPWEAIANILLPRNELWRFGGEMYIGYEDGTSTYRDQFGRTSKAHEWLTKPLLANEPEPDAPCGCGSGIAFGECCADRIPHRRPSWTVMSIRERNLAHIRGIEHILGLDKEQPSWLDVRRDLTNDQVRQIHTLHAALWPTDTQLIELLPRPQSKRSRAVYLGMTDARTVSITVTGLLHYVDELILVHPFVNANGVNPEFSPVHHPEQFREQTLRSVFLLMVLESGINDGRIHLVPDPLDYDVGFREEIIAITERNGNEVKMGPVDKKLSRLLCHDEMMRAVKRMPPAELKAYIKRKISDEAQQPTEAVINSIVDIWKKELEQDPFALLEPLGSEKRGEFRMLKGFARETGLFMATLTGSIVYTESDTQWARLHETDGVHQYEPGPATEGVVRCLENVYVKVPTLSYYHEAEPSGASEIRTLLRRAAVALKEGVTVDIAAQVTGTKVPSFEEGFLLYKLRASAPQNGFQRTDVSRLTVTFGRVDDVMPVQLGLFLEHVSQNEETRQASAPGDDTAISGSS
jgi:hypothetical protein